MGDEATVSLPLNDDEQEMISLLRDELGLEDDAAVVRLLVEQAVQRLLVTCPTCGHYARKTAEDEANCRSCMSVIKLSEGLWQIEQ
jgi:hypothetical protein